MNKNLIVSIISLFAISCLFVSFGSVKAYDNYCMISDPCYNSGGTYWYNSANHWNGGSWWNHAEWIGSSYMYVDCQGWTIGEWQNNEYVQGHKPWCYWDGCGGHPNLPGTIYLDVDQYIFTYGIINSDSNNGVFGMCNAYVNLWCKFDYPVNGVEYAEILIYTFNMGQPVCPWPDTVYCETRYQDGDSWYLLKYAEWPGVTKFNWQQTQTCLDPFVTAFAVNYGIPYWDIQIIGITQGVECTNGFIGLTAHNVYYNT